MRIAAIHKHLARCALATLGALPLAQPSLAQMQTDDTSATEDATQFEFAPQVPPDQADDSRYNLWLGPAKFAISAGVRAEYSDNIFLSHSAVRDDFSLSPRLNLDSFVPIGKLNNLSLGVGISYYHYFKNNQLNTDLPLINPDSELAFRIYAGDFTLKLSESFSYQESPAQEYGSTFYNVYNTTTTGPFARFDNRIGPSVTWNLNDLVLTAGYTHEDYFAKDTYYNYINRTSEQFKADAMFAFAPSFSAGLEGNGSVNSFANRPLSDQWRAGGGPTLQFALTEFITARVGGGYETINYTSDRAPLYGLSAQDTYYLYANVDHIINRVFKHSLNFSRDNQTSVSAGNIEQTQIGYSLTWKALEKLTITPHASVSFDKESNSSNFGFYYSYSDTFTYWSYGINSAYDIDGKWRLGLSWNARVKDSQTAVYGYSQNVARLELTYRF